MTTLCTLPEDMLARIFSYLDTQQILKISRVNKHFHVVSKSAIVYEKVILRLNSKNCFVSMCDFLMQQKEYIKKLCLHYKEPFIHNNDRMVILKIMFSRLEQLICLNVENLDIRFVDLPPTLKHLSVQCVSYPDCDSSLNGNECVIFYLHKALVECPLMEKICVYAADDFSSNLVNFLDIHVDEIRTHASKLTSLAIFPMCYEIMPIIKFFSNLKELGLYFSKKNNDYLILESDLVPIVNFPNLNLFFLRCDHALLAKIYRAFASYELPKITHFSVMVLSDSFLKESDFDHIRRLFPNLRTYYGKGQCRRNNSDFYKFITECKHLKSFYYEYSGSLTALSTFINDILCLDKQKKFETLCFCQALNNVCYKDGKNIKHVSKEIKEKLSNYPCGKLHVKELRSPKCFCRFPRLEPENIEKYQLIPHCNTIPDPQPEPVSDDDI